ncbi:MAG: LacI family DNA-binding transcriptional regulator [Lentisphaeria bacterium]|nr:LacI family DNA-binding transcriptional regulator [Lentisphaeria bacterium]
MAGTLKIIAERAGLSQSTVSQILNRRSNDFSSEKTRQRVFSLAHELGYKQQFGHKLLRGDKTQTVAILLSQHRVSLEEHIQALILRLLDQLESRDYGAYLVTLSHSEEKNLDSIRELIGRGVESFIFLGHPVGAAALEKYISEADRTLVGDGNFCSRKVIIDTSGSTAEMIRFFLARGHRNFRIFLGDRPHAGRVDGLRKVFPGLTAEELLQKYRISLGPLGDHDDIDTFAETGYQVTKQTFEQDPSIDGCIYLSDYFAVGGLRYLMETGRQIGKEVLVAGFNNIHAIRNFPLPVTSAEHDVPRIAEALIEEMTQKGPVERIIPTRTIIRE